MGVKTVAHEVGSGMKVVMKTNGNASDLVVDDWLELALRHYVNSGYKNKVSIVIHDKMGGEVLLYADPMADE